MAGAVEEGLLTATTSKSSQFKKKKKNATIKDTHPVSFKTISKNSFVCYQVASSVAAKIVLPGSLPFLKKCKMVRCVEIPADCCHMYKGEYKLILYLI